MANIKQLPPEVADQISAGEVIERPASVVKELVENSIDADSTRILIEVKNGGKDKIRIKDNGSGISGDELELAFSRYATSKIDNINDLYSLRSLGFRGEALASIASVSKVKVVSRTPDEVKGNKLVIEGSKIIDKTPTGSPQGTDIEVSDLFYNTPARFKYMKTTNTELGHISNIINNEAIAYPEIQFTLTHNGRQLLKTPGNGKLKDTLFSIFGRELVDKLIPVNFEENYIQIHGYIARPEFNRSSRIYEMFYVNQRAVHNTFLSRGVEEGFKGLLPPRTYPAVFLFIKLNPILIDVNVHPTKKEVKFSRNQVIKETIRKGIKGTLQKIDPSAKIKRKNSKSATNRKKYKKEKLNYIEEENIKTGSKVKENIQSKNKLSDQKQTPDNPTNNKSPNVRQKNNKKIEHRRTNSDQQQIKSKNKNYKATSSQTKINKKTKKDSLPKTQSSNHTKNTTENNNFNTNSTNNTNNDINTYQQTEQNDQESDINQSNNNPVQKILGQIHNTYIIVEINDGLYIIDQHAAHERILYDRLMEKYNNKDVISQPLLLPINIELTIPEIEIVKKYKSDLKELGLVLELFGSKSFIIQEVPTIMKKKSSKKVIKDIIDKLLDSGKTMKQNELISEIITYMACHSAIKAGQYLEKQELERIIVDLFSTSNPYRCPHGRPAIIHFSKNDLEREVGRK